MIKSTILESHKTPIESTSYEGEVSTGKFVLVPISAKIKRNNRNPINKNPIVILR